MATRPDAPKIKATRLTQAWLEDFVTNPLEQGEPALAYDTGSLFIGTGTANRNISSATNIVIPSSSFNGTLLTDTENTALSALQKLDDVFDGSLSQDVTIDGQLTLEYGGALNGQAGIRVFISEAVGRILEGYNLSSNIVHQIGVTNSGDAYYHGKSSGGSQYIWNFGPTGCSFNNQGSGTQVFSLYGVGGLEAFRHDPGNDYIKVQTDFVPTHKTNDVANIVIGDGAYVDSDPTYNTACTVIGGNDGTYYAYSNSDYVTILGTGSYVDGSEDSVAIGDYVFVGGGGQNTAVGSGAYVYGNRNIGIGRGVYLESQSDAIAVGAFADAYGSDRTIQIGSYSYSGFDTGYKDDMILLGYGSACSTENTLQIGSNRADLTVSNKTGNFQSGDVIVGSSSGATAIVVGNAFANPMQVAMTSSTEFTSSDSITGSLSGHSADIDSVSTYSSSISAVNFNRGVEGITISNPLKLSGDLTLDDLSGNNDEVVTLDANGKLQVTGVTLTSLTSGEGGWNIGTGRTYVNDASYNVVIGRTSSQYVQYEHSDLVTNGAFTTDSDWTKGTGWTISSGVASIDGTQTADSDLSQQLTLTSGVWYKVSFTLSGTSEWTGGGDSYLNIYIEDDATGDLYSPDLSGYVITLSGSYYAENGTFAYSIYYEGAGTANLIFRANENFIGSIDDVELREDRIGGGSTPILDHYGLEDENIYEDVFRFGTRNGYDNDTGLKRVVFLCQFANPTGSGNGTQKAVAWGAEVQDKYSNYPSFFTWTGGVKRFRIGRYGSTFIGSTLNIGDPTLDKSMTYSSTLVELYRKNSDVIESWVTGSGTNYSLIKTTGGRFHIQEKTGSNNTFTIDGTKVGILTSTPANTFHVNGEVRVSAQVGPDNNGCIQYDGTFKGRDESWKEFVTCTDATNKIISGYSIASTTFDSTNTFELQDVVIGNGSNPNFRLHTTGLWDTYYANSSTGRFTFMPFLFNVLTDIFRYDRSQHHDFEYHNGSSWVSWTGITEADYKSAFQGMSNTRWEITEDYANFRFQIDIPSWRHSHYLFVYQEWSNGDRTYSVKVEYWNGSAWVTCADTITQDNENMLFLPFTVNPGASTTLRVTFDVEGIIDVDSKFFRIASLQCLTARAGNTSFDLFSSNYERQVGFYDDVSIGNSASIYDSARLYVKGSTSDNTEYATLVRNSSNTSLFSVRNDEVVQLKNTLNLDDGTNVRGTILGSLEGSWAGIGTGYSIYNSLSGGSDPFDVTGNLIIQTQTNNNRDICLVTGTTPVVRMKVGDTIDINSQIVTNVVINKDLGTRSSNDLNSFGAHHLVLEGGTDEDDYASIAFATSTTYPTGAIIVTDEGSSTRGGMHFYTNNITTNSALTEHLWIDYKGATIFNFSRETTGDFAIRDSSTGNMYFCDVSADTHTFNGNTTFGDDVSVTGDVDAATVESPYYYLGDPDTDGTWRITPSGSDLVFQRRESGSYVTKDTITA